MNNEKHFCQLSFPKDGYQRNCLGKIKGKVLKTEIVFDKQNKTEELCYKIRINKKGEKGEGYNESKKYLVYYGLENYGKLRLKKYKKIEIHEKEKTYWFFLHEVGDGEKILNEGWKWFHDWQIIEK